MVASLFAAPRADASTTTSGPFVYVKTSGTVGTGAVALGADCPKGRVTGAGGAITTGSMTRMEPMDALIGGDGKPDDFVSSEAWTYGPGTTLTAVAICMKGKIAASLGYQQTTVPITSTTTGFAGSVLGCAQQRIGGGAGANPDGQTVLARSMPDAAENWNFQVFHDSGSSSNTVSGVIACLPAGMAHIRRVSKSSTIGTNGSGIARVHCPPGFHVSAGGVDVPPGAINASVPYDDGDPDRAPDDGWLAKVAGTPKYEFSVYAVCVK